MTAASDERANQNSIIRRLRQYDDQLTREAGAALIERLQAEIAELTRIRRAKMGDALRLAQMAGRRRNPHWKVGGRNWQSDQTAREAAARAEQLRPILAELEHLSATKAAAELNRRQIETPLGGRWWPVGVIRVRTRIAQRPVTP